MLKYLLFFILAVQTASVRAGEERGTINEVGAGEYGASAFGPRKNSRLSHFAKAIPKQTVSRTLPQSSPPFDLDSIRCRVSSRTVVNVPCNEPGHEIYGFGLDPGADKQKGLAKNLTVCAAVMEKTGASHGPVPFYLSTKGYGVYASTPPASRMSRSPRLTPNQSAAASDALRRIY